MTAALGVWLMRIGDVLRAKRDHRAVVTVTPETTVQRLLAVLAEHRIGAAVVSQDGRSVQGIVSERDVARVLAGGDAGVLRERVAAICTAQVYTATPETELVELMRLMTEHRIRHVPVVVSGALHGIVSIGDVVRTRIDELESERAALADYILGPH